MSLPGPLEAYRLWFSYMDLDHGVRVSIRVNSGISEGVTCWS